MAENNPKQKPLASNETRNEPSPATGGKAFKKLLGDFSNGVKALQDIVGRKTFTQQDFPQKNELSSGEVAGKIAQALHFPKSEPPPGHPKDPAQTVQTITNNYGYDFKHPKATVEQAAKKMELSSLASIGGSPIANGANRDAMQQILGHGSSEPAPARISRILKSAKSSEHAGMVPTELRQLATAAKEGRLRDVADISPEKVESYVNKQPKGLALNPQESEDKTMDSIIANHDNTVNMVRSSIKEEANRGESPNIAPRLANMAATNDEPHLYDAQHKVRNRIMQHGRSVQSHDRVMATTHALSSGSSGTKAVNFQRKIEAASGYVPSGVNRGSRGAGNPLSHEETTLPKHPSANDSGGGKKGSAKEVTITGGSCKIVGENGQGSGNLVFGS